MTTQEPQIEQLLSRRTELRFQIQGYTSPWHSRYKGAAGREYGQMMAAPLKRELAAVEAELKSKKQNHQPMSRADRWGYTLLVALFAVICAVGGPLVAIADGEILFGLGMFFVGVILALVALCISPDPVTS